MSYAVNSDYWRDFTRSSITYHYGVAAFHSDDIEWFESFIEAANYMRTLPEATQLLRCIRRKVFTAEDQGDIFLVYPFNITLQPTLTQLNNQILRIDTLWNTFHKLSPEQQENEIQKIRLAFYPKDETTQQDSLVLQLDQFTPQ